MAAVELLCQLAGIDSCIFSKDENLLLEAELFSRISEKLMENFIKKFKGYFCSKKLTCEKEDAMFEGNFAYFIVEDILETEEYTLAGIAKYTDTHEDIVQEIVSRSNTRPSAIVVRRLIELHRSVRPDLYEGIIKKIIVEYSKSKRETT